MQVEIEEKHFSQINFIYLFSPQTSVFHILTPVDFLDFFRQSRSAPQNNTTNLCARKSFRE